MPDTKPQTLRERGETEAADRFNPQGNDNDSYLKRRAIFFDGAEWGAREVLSAPVSDAVVEDACEAHWFAKVGPLGTSWADERALMGEAWAHERRKWMRASISAAFRARAEEMGVHPDG